MYTAAPCGLYVGDIAKQNFLKELQSEHLVGNKFVNMPTCDDMKSVCAGDSMEHEQLITIIQNFQDVQSSYTTFRRKSRLNEQIASFMILRKQRW